MILILFTLFICLLISYHFLRTYFGFRWISGMVINLSLFLTGMSLITVIEKNTCLQSEKALEGNKEGIYICRVNESLVAKSATSRGIIVAIAKMDSLGVWHPLDCKFLGYFKNDSLCSSLEYGDLILISGCIMEIPEPANPYMFNYRQYLNNRQVCHQVFLTPGQWKWMDKSVPNPARFWAERCRGAFLDVLKKFKVEGQDFALVSALLLGSKEFLETETIREFSQAGAIHVLSVSGLHVGIMYVVADKLLFFLKRGRKSRKLHHILIICLIWAYAFISGLPSSVIRASLMFSLIAVGKMFKRSSENYNILAVAAFFQLWINPYEIAQVGFQLSYLAVLGIFAFYKPMNDLASPGNRILSWIWPVLAVSMAAQLATFPLASYYFNMFPVYFLLTNLIVVPMAAVITYFAVFLLMAGAAGLIFDWLAWPLIWSLRFMSGSVEVIQSWPGAVIEQVVFTRGQVILIYIAIFSIFVFFIMANRRGIITLMFSFLLFSGISVKSLIERSNSAEIIVYQIPGHTAIDLLHNRQALFICDSNLSCNTVKTDFQIKPNRIKNGIRDIRLIEPGDEKSANIAGVWADNPFIYFRGKKLVIIDHTWRPPHQGHFISCDLAVISESAQIRPEELGNQIAWQYLVIDSSVPFYRAEKLVQDFKNEGMTCHSVRHEGAFVIRW